MARQSKPQRIYRDIRTKIDSGELQVGQALPPEKELAREYGVAVVTLRHALGLLREEGWITSRRYHGTHVSSPDLHREKNEAKIIGLFVPAGTQALTHPVFSRLVNGIEGVLCAAGYVLDLAFFDNAKDPVYETELLRKLNESSCRGWLIPGGSISDAVFYALTAKQMPIVVIRRPHPLLKTHSFFPDDEAVGIELFTHLVEQGYLNPWMVFPASMGHWKDCLIELANRFRDRFPLKVHTLDVKDYSVGSGRDAVLQILSSSLPVDAIICGDDEMAIGVLEELKVQGKRVPEIGVIGGGDSPISNLSQPTLTSINYPYYLIGREAGRLLIDLVEGVKIDPIQRKYVPKLVIRESSVRGRPRTAIHAQWTPEIGGSQPSALIRA